jgi:iron complex outermembrane receptor protein
MPERAMARTAAQMQSVVTVSIAPQPLGDALNELARQANVPLNFAADAVANRTAPALSGRSTVTEAFEKLLAGSGLAARLEGEVVLVRAATQGQAAQPNELQSVVVTARRPSNDSIVVRRSTGGALFGESDVREIPFSVNIVGEAEIKNRQATTLSEMLSTDPSIGFVYQDGGGMPFERLTIRGFTQGNQVVNGQLTGLDVIAIQAANVDRVEVLRGPAAFRYGFVNPGGVVNTVTKRPTSRPQTLMSLTGAAESQLGVQVDHSSQFDSERKFGYRINALYSEPPRVLRRLQPLRGWSHEQDLTKQDLNPLFARVSGTRGAHGV